MAPTTRKKLECMLDYCGSKKGKHYISLPEVNSVIYNQEDCEMCWSVSSTECIAIAKWLIGHHSTFFPLSSSEIYDFVNSDSNSSGRYSFKKAYDHMSRNGVVREAQYPFLARKSVWKRTPEMERKKVRIEGHERLDAENEEQLMSALKEYPFTAGLYVDSSFRDLQSEIYVPERVPTGDDLKEVLKASDEIRAELRRRKALGEVIYPMPKVYAFHAVLVVGSGYDWDEGKGFWVFKNSFGKNWGIEGFGRVAKASSIDKTMESSLIQIRRPLF